MAKLQLQINAEKKPNKVKKMVLITADTPIGEIVTKYPELAEVLTEDYGFHCVGCFASTMETLEQGAEVHGMSETEVKEMVVKLNKFIA